MGSSYICLRVPLDDVTIMKKLTEWGERQFDFYVRTFVTKVFHISQPTHGVVRKKKFIIPESLLLQKHISSGTQVHVIPKLYGHQFGCFHDSNAFLCVDKS